ncbi:hypothetical protein JYU20_04250, partial [Bacteroidales bacterium AH-315-I05]|nr:hypothetical protein [Bacteroidales bacterium AH-315-I05]
KHGDGATLLRLSIKRPWVFRQTGAGPAGKLDLRAIADFKSFQITSPNGNRAAQFLVRDATNGTQVYLVPDGGRVGIATTNPGAKLEIFGDNTDNLMYLRNNISSAIQNGTASSVNMRIGSPFIIRFDDSANGAYIAGPNHQSGQRNFGVTGARALEFGGWSGNEYQPWMVLRSSQLKEANVGIGTLAPQKTLHLKTKNGIGLGNNSTSIRIEKSLTTDITGLSAITTWDLEAEADVSNIGKFHIGTPGSPVMTLTEDGNAGIGTTTPDVKFQVANSDNNTNIESILSTARVSIQNLANTDNNTSTLSFDNSVGQPSASISAVHLDADGAFGSGRSGELRFGTSNPGNSGSLKTRMIIKNNGRVGIGTTNPQAELAVNGKICAKEVRVSLDNGAPCFWPDYVFDKNYELSRLSEVEAYINTNGHLPDIPSAKDVTENGLELGTMNALLLKKIEELTLYTIQQQKLINDLQKDVNELKK